jgi:hypothetical protein
MLYNIIMVILKILEVMALWCIYTVMVDNFNYNGWRKN